jgi:hypothetical protein
MPKIDFVIPWVDGKDPEWIELFNQYAPIKKTQIEEKEHIHVKRFEDVGLLRYCFRCIEKNAPWVHKVFFITNGQKPDWLNVNHEKIVWVNHEDYIPKEWLPTFSANPIEVNLHRIKGLSEHFVYFNDDFFIINKIKESYYFNKKGLPCDYALLGSVPPGYFGHIIINNLVEINARFNKKNTILKNKSKWFNLIYGRKLLRLLMFIKTKRFTGFGSSHTSQAFLKSTYEEVWKNCEEVLQETSSHKFRNITDVSQYLFRYWQLVTGNFHPVSPKGRKAFQKIKNADIEEIAKCFSHKNIKEVCINDGEYHPEIIELFEKHFPEKSSFEL